VYKILHSYFCLPLEGEVTWEPRECFVDADGTENDIFQDYNTQHPIKQNKKRKMHNSTQINAPRASKKRRNTQ